MAIAPQTTSYQRDRVRESWPLLLIPGSGPHWHHLTLNQLRRHQRNQREEPEKQRRRARNRRLTLLALRFDAPDNVAKPLIEFAVNIPRERLRLAPADRRRPG